ncbi:MAG: FecR domain-containing protein [Bacteroidota bacterium]
MDNDRFIKLITRYLSKEATLKEIEELNSYLEDAEYKDLFEVMSMQWESKNNISNDSNYDFERGMSTLLNKIKVYEPKYKKAKAHQRHVGLLKQFIFKAAASIAFITILAYGFYILFFPSKNNEPKYTFNEEITAPGQKSFITLIDGTKITLNAESQLLYPISFVNNERTVELVGEAYFEVAHDPEKPFKVITNNVVTTALGTTFDVKAYPNEKSIIVSLVEGKVKVENRENELILTPMEQLKYELTSKSMVMNNFDLIQTVGWKDNILVFKEEPLEEILIVLKRTFGVDVELSDPTITNVKINANFENESFWTIINTLKSFTKLEYKTISENNILQKVIFYKKSV